MVKNVYNEPEALAEIPSESSKKGAIFAQYNIFEAHSWEIGQCMPNSTLHWQINFWFIYYFKEHFIIYI